MLNVLNIRIILSFMLMRFISCPLSPWQSRIYAPVIAIRKIQPHVDMHTHGVGPMATLAAACKVNSVA